MGPRGSRRQRSRRFAANLTEPTFPPSPVSVITAAIACRNAHLGRLEAAEENGNGFAFFQDQVDFTNLDT